MPRTVMPLLVALLFFEPIKTLPHLNVTYLCSPKAYDKTVPSFLEAELCFSCVFRFERFDCILPYKRVYIAMEPLEFSRKLCDYPLRKCALSF